MGYVRQAKSFYIFYVKIFFPALALSALMGFIGASNSASTYFNYVGIAIILITPLMHYLTYELRSNNEYFFYFNQGLSKTRLWILSCLTSFLIGLLFLLV